MMERRPTFEVIYRDKKVIIEEIHLPQECIFLFHLKTNYRFSLAEMKIRDPGLQHRQVTRK
jgi:hypothetical protein